MPICAIENQTVILGWEGDWELIRIMCIFCTSPPSFSLTHFFLLILFYFYFLYSLLSFWISSSIILYFLLSSPPFIPVQCPPTLLLISSFPCSPIVMPPISVINSISLFLCPLSISPLPSFWSPLSWLLSHYSAPAALEHIDLLGCWTRSWNVWRFAQTVQKIIIIFIINFNYKSLLRVARCLQWRSPL